MRIFEFDEGRALNERLRIERRNLLAAARGALESCRFDDALAHCAELIARDGIGRLDLLREHGRLARGPDGLRFVWHIPDLPFATGIFTWVARTLRYDNRAVADFRLLFDGAAAALFTSLAAVEPATSPTRIWDAAHPWLDAAYAREKAWRPIDGRIARL